jgi:hypothetical protein
MSNEAMDVLNACEAARVCDGVFVVGGAERMGAAIERLVSAGDHGILVGEDSVVSRVIVPASEAGVVTINLMPSALGGSGKYGVFVDAVHLLESK